MEGNKAEIWHGKERLIIEFLQRQRDHEQLCLEVAYILRKRLREQQIAFSAVTHRAKSLASFLDKCIRKSYDDPLAEITDLAGVRVVYLYLQDFPKIETLINEEFEVLEKVVKQSELGPGQAGYEAVQFVVRLGKKSSGARYDDLRSLLCEIQVRTILQDAWAIIDHHLVYKHEATMPDTLKRELRELMSIFKLADTEFDRIRTGQKAYLDAISLGLELEGDKLLEKGVDTDSVEELLRRRFPLAMEESPAYGISEILEKLDKSRYRKLVDIAAILFETEEVRRKYFSAIGENYETFWGIGHLTVALAFVDKEFRSKFEWADEADRVFAEFDKSTEGGSVAAEGNGL